MITAPIRLRCPAAFAAPECHFPRSFHRYRTASSAKMPKKTPETSSQSTPESRTNGPHIASPRRRLSRRSPCSIPRACVTVRAAVETALLAAVSGAVRAVAAPADWAAPVVACLATSVARRNCGVCPPFAPAFEPLSEGNQISFKVTGAGALIGVGNGDPNCQESDKEPKRSLFNGLAQAIVQAARIPGTITVEAYAEEWPGPKLPSTTLSITTKRAVPRPSA